MCKYCENIEEAEDRKLTKDITIDLGVLGKITSDLYMWRSVGDDYDEYGLCHSVGSEYLDYEYESVRINYCPFCGRKLSKESE